MSFLSPGLKHKWILRIYKLLQYHPHDHGVLNETEGNPESVEKRQRVDDKSPHILTEISETMSIGRELTSLYCGRFFVIGPQDLVL